MNTTNYLGAYKVICLREQPAPESLKSCGDENLAAQYFREIIQKEEWFNPEAETLVVLLLNVRRQIKGHVLISTGTMDTILVHPREVFRAAIISSAHSIILMHNHPSGDPCPSDADIRVTRELIRAGQILKVELLDHVIIGANRHSSLKTSGYFYA